MPAQARSVVVHKFGGAALADAGAIASVVRLLALDRTGTRRVVAASALMGVTDALVQMSTMAAGGNLDAALDAAREQCLRHQAVATDLLLDSPAIAEGIDASFEELEQMLDRVATTFESDVDVKLTRMTALLEPMILVVMGGVVAFIVFSILQPIMDLGNLSGPK